MNSRINWASFVYQFEHRLEPNNFPAISVFNNAYQYNEMLIERDIQVYSCCEHNFVPFVGKPPVAYFPSNEVIGLSKLNRGCKIFFKATTGSGKVNNGCR